jgi:asparagine synthase (glutamine-hydrolysing)
MCGIAGLISKTNSTLVKDTVFTMSQTIKHRGPDGEGFTFFSESDVIPVYSNETPRVNKESKQFKFNPSVAINNIGSDYSVALAHRRLSIIDLSESGHQPMCDTSGDYWVTFNGEVYNYIELREELKQKGHVFVTQTDTEVVVAAYKEWGTNCLTRFNGMFAFALLDKKNNQLFCARDRVGVKPFYFINTNHAFAFASEYKAFIKSGLVKFEINEAHQFDYLVNANLESEEQSLFKGITELKPSHFFVYDLKTHQVSLKQYYFISSNTISTKSESEIIDLVEEKVINSIKLRLRSDVEIGSCLSGGLDSSIIAGVIKHLQPDQNLKLFTAVFPNEKFDESNYAKLMSDSVNGNWKTVSPTADEFFRDIETLNYYQDIPVWSTSTYSQHRVMKLAAENNIKVVLDGQGADELFGGYAHHYVSYWRENSVLPFKQIKESEATIHKPYQLFFKQLLKDTFNLSANYSEYLIDSKKQFGKSIHQAFSNNLNEELKKDYHGKLKSFLKCEDRCSMAFGIESRVPFADDVDLVDFIFSVEGKRKIKNGVSKYLLREATRSFVPSQIYSRRDKVGFETPLANWFSPNKTQVLETILSQLDFVSQDYLKSNFEKLLQQKPTFLLRLYSLAVWKKVFSNI